LREALAPLADNIHVAFMHGSMVEGRERSESDIDLIIVGEVAGPDLAFALRNVQNRLGREVNFTRYTPLEFASKIAAGHHFLKSVLKKPRIFLIGGEHELDDVAGGKTRRTRANEQERIR
jgi:predicted nucleotidyltransferase